MRRVVSRRLVEQPVIFVVERLALIEDQHNQLGDRPRLLAPA